jgi:hypothetical protein
MKPEQLSKTLKRSQARQEEIFSAQNHLKSLTESKDSITRDLEEKLRALEETQELRDAQEKFALVTQIASSKGINETNVFRIDFKHTSGHFTQTETFKPEDPKKLKGAAKLFWDWLIVEGFKPQIKGEREEYFGKNVPTSTGLNIVVGIEEIKD